jgi:type VII secretion integral membrane protein EccD
LEYDDVVDVIAAGARRYGRGWDASATRATGLALAGALLLLGLVALLRTGTGGPALGLGALLIAAGALASRTAGDALTGVTLAALGAPYASAGAVLAAFGRPYAGAAPARPGLGPSLLLGSAVLILACVLAALGVGHGVRVFTGGAVAGLAGVLGAALSWRLNAPGCAAVVVTALVTGVGAVPLLATRLGHLPVPVLAGGGEAHPRPERARVYAAVVRTDELLTGTLLGVAGAAAAGTLVLILFGGGSAWLLAGVAATGLALRARVFPALRQRLPLLLAGAVGYLTLLTGLVARVPPAGPLLPGLALIVVAAATRYRDRPPGPHLGRAADLLDALCVVAAVPAACAVLGLYGAVGGLVS